MTEDIYDSCKRIVNFVPAYVNDTYIEKKLRQAIDYHLSEGGKDDMANVKLFVNGKEYPIIYDAISESPEFKDIEIIFYDFKLGTGQRYDVPTTKLKILPNGVGWLHLLEKTEEKDIKNSLDKSSNQSDQSQIIKSMFRLYTTKHFKPQPVKVEIANDSEGIEPILNPYGLLRIEQLWSIIKQEGIIPIQIKLCAYSQSTRFIYHIDLLRDRLLKDIREDNIPIINRIKRSGHDFYQLDKILTMKEIPELSKKILEIIFESNEIDSIELTQIFHSQEKSINQYVDVLVKRGFVTLEGKPSKPKLVANIDAISKVV